MATDTYAVWWASAGCLPDSETPAFIGTLTECEDYISEDPDGYFDTVGEHNLYDFGIYPYEPEEDVHYDFLNPISEKENN